MTAERRRRVAYCTVPHVGGTYSAYRNMRRHLAPHGWEALAVSIGRDREHFVYRPDFADAGERVVAGGEADPRAACRAFVDWLEREEIDVVMPLVSRLALSAIPHLPPRVRLVHRCVNSYVQAYRTVAVGIDRASRVVTLSERGRADLTRFLGPAGAAKLALIPNAVDPARFAPGPAVPPRGPAGDRLELLYLGRYDDREKGVRTLPGVAQELARRSVPFRLTLHGSGADGDDLRRRFAAAGLSADVAAVRDPVGPDEVPATLAAADVFLLPSRHDGFPNALVEAMAAGCVPVASRLAGITDWILKDGVDGLLCPVGDAAAFAAAVERLHRDRDLLASASAAARRTVADRFDVADQAESYAALFAAACDEPDGPPPKPWDAFEAYRDPPKRLPFVPDSWKRAARAGLEHWRTRKP